MKKALWEMKQIVNGAGEYLYANWSISLDLAGCTNYAAEIAFVIGAQTQQEIIDFHETLMNI
nr:MAG: hypothetical protein [Lokiarchaeota virus Ratatoskr Meg22_1012]